MIRYPICSLRSLTVLLAGLCLAHVTAQAQITPQITASRTQGVAPLAVFFDASATTATGVAHPFHLLDYRWNFDETNTNPANAVWATSGLSKEHATGPVAAHVFEVPGTYTVRLEVENAAGQLATTTVQITVQNPDTFYSGSNTIVFANAPGNFGGKPAGAHEVRATTLGEVLAHAASGKRLLLRRGDTFTTTGNHTLTATNVTLGAYGPGTALPEIRLTDNKSMLKPDCEDWRFMDLKVTGPGSGGGTNFVMAEGQCKNLLFLRIKATPGTFHAGYSMGYKTLVDANLPLHDGLFFVENDIRDVGYGNGGNHLFVAARRLGVLGNHFEDAGDGEHIIRAQHVDRGVISSNFLSRQNRLKNVLTIRSNRNNPGSNCLAGCGEPTQKVLVADNYVISNESNTIECTTENRPRDGDIAKGENIIFERNFITNSGTAEDYGVEVGIRTTGDSSYVTVRNNIVLMTGWQGYRPFDVSGHTEWVYNNTAYTPTAVSSTVRTVLARPSGTNQTVFNNLLYAPNATGSKRVLDGTPQSAGNNVLATSNPFVVSNPSSPQHFALHSGSQARNAGAAVAVFQDFALNDRPSEGSWDAGAFEFQSGGGGGPVSVTGVSLNPASLSLNVGQSQSLSVSIVPSNATNQGVSFSSNNPSVAAVNGSGLVSAVAAGTAVNTVTTTDGSHTDTATVTVQGGGGGGPSADFIIDNTDSAVSFHNGTFWVVTAGSGYHGSNFHTATSGYARYSPNFSGIEGSYEIFVKYASGWSNLGTDCPYTVNHTSGSTTIPVNQTINGGQWVSIGTFSMGVGSTVDIGTSLSNGKRPSVDAIRFVGNGSGTVAVTGVDVSPASVSLEVGDTASLSASVTPSNATNPAVSWSSSNPSVASVNSSGTVTAFAAGSATITATTVDGSHTDQSSITVTAPQAVDLVVDNLDSAVSFHNGSFWTVTAGSGYHGSNFHTATSGYARYSPDFSGIEGTYEIFVRYGSGWSHLGTDCPYTVNHANGSTTVTVNQTINGGQWVSIGTFTLNTNSSVDIGTGLSNSKRPAVDAIRFVK